MVGLGSEFGHVGMMYWSNGKDFADFAVLFFILFLFFIFNIFSVLQIELELFDFYCYTDIFRTIS